MRVKRLAVDSEFSTKNPPLLKVQDETAEEVKQLHRH